MIRTEGQEGSVKFLFDPVGDIVKLHVKNIDTGREISHEYKCMYKPIFGHDAADVQQVEAKMDEMINTVMEG